MYAFLFLLIDTDLAYIQLLPSRMASTQTRRRLGVRIGSSPAHLQTNADKYEAFSKRCSASLEAYYNYESQLKAAIHSNAYLRSDDALWTRRRSGSNHETTSIRTPEHPVVQGPRKLPGTLSHMYIYSYNDPHVIGELWGSGIRHRNGPLGDMPRGPDASMENHATHGVSDANLGQRHKQPSPHPL